jgi:hypothetical protein
MYGAEKMCIQSFGGETEERKEVPDIDGDNIKVELQRVGWGV